MVEVVMTKELAERLHATKKRDFEIAALRKRIAELERDNIDFLQTWMRTPNPMLGDTSPLDLCKMGLGHRLAQFIETAYEANQEPT